MIDILTWQCIANKIQQDRDSIAGPLKHSPNAT